MEDTRENIVQRWSSQGRLAGSLYLQSPRLGLEIVGDAPMFITYAMDPPERIAVRMQPRSARDALPPHIENSTATKYTPIVCASNEWRLLSHWSWLLRSAVIDEARRSMSCSIR